jgi:hypothetical protein
MQESLTREVADFEHPAPVLPHRRGNRATASGDIDEIYRSLATRCRAAGDGLLPSEKLGNPTAIAQELQFVSTDVKTIHRNHDLGEIAF